jgi:hypothetical protein
LFVIKRSVLISAGWLGVLFGGAVFALTGRTPAFAYRWFIRLFCLTGGRSNDMLSALVARFNPVRPLPARGGPVVPLTSAQFESAQAALRTRGFYVLPHHLPADMCERLLQFALREPSVIRADDSPTEFAGQRRPYQEDRGKPCGVRYDFEMQDLLRNPDVQRLISDPALLSLAQGYFGSAPRADVLGLWWNTAYTTRPSENAAQLFHFDLDRIKWLKVFIYLTDVKPENGPHSFVAGSHRSFGIPAEFLDKGYVRLTDEEVGRRYSRDDIIEFSGPRGTILIEDTRGLHKGKLVGIDDRLVLQVQFSNSLFGATYAKARLPAAEMLVPDLRAQLSAARGTYQNFL